MRLVEGKERERKNKRTHQPANLPTQQPGTHILHQRKPLRANIIPSKAHIILPYIALSASRPVPDGEGGVHVEGGAGEGDVVEGCCGRAAGTAGGSEAEGGGEPEVGGTERGGSEGMEDRGGLWTRGSKERAKGGEI
jgi:hypothetical protein